jgi:hypothetical protein
MTDNRKIVFARAIARLAVEREAAHDWLAEINNSHEYAGKSHLYYAYLDKQKGLTAALEFRTRTQPAIYE